jgi:hypothetical protein
MSQLGPRANGVRSSIVSAPAVGIGRRSARQLAPSDSILAGLLVAVLGRTR